MTTRQLVHSFAPVHPKLKEGCTYVMTVKNTFSSHGEPKKYDEFVAIMKDYKEKRIGNSEVCNKITELYKGYPQLIPGFNSFVPKGYEIEVPAEKTNVFDKLTEFGAKIKDRFENVEEHVYDSYQGIVQWCKKENKSINDVYREVATLFRNRADLLEEFKASFPDALATVTVPSSISGDPSMPSVSRSDPPFLNYKRRQRSIRRRPVPPIAVESSVTSGSNKRVKGKRAREP